MSFKTPEGSALWTCDWAQSQPEGQWSTLRLNSATQYCLQASFHVPCPHCSLLPLRALYHPKGHVMILTQDAALRVCGPSPVLFCRAVLSSEGLQGSGLPSSSSELLSWSTRVSSPIIHPLSVWKYADVPNTCKIFPCNSHWTCGL